VRSTDDDEYAVFKAAVSGRSAEETLIELMKREFKKEQRDT